jgi:hypothetical protein
VSSVSAQADTYESRRSWIDGADGSATTLRVANAVPPIADPKAGGGQGFEVLIAANDDDVDVGAQSFPGPVMTQTATISLYERGLAVKVGHGS